MSVDTGVDRNAWREYISDIPARRSDEATCAVLMDQLAEAERLLFDEGWTTDDPWPGIVYQRGRGWQRVDVAVWVLMRALMRGLGEAGLRRDRAARGI